MALIMITQKIFLKNCRGQLAVRGKNVHQVNKRNPFNLRIIQHDVYIYEIDLNKLKKCKIK